MKKIFFCLTAILVMGACRSKETGENAKADTSVVVTKTDTGSVKADSHYSWTSELDQDRGLVMKKTTVIENDSLNPANIIRMLNEKFPEIRLELARISNDSIFVAIRKSNYLTRQMGSSGADAYLAEVTYNLTELTGINYVDIRFREGDHASPGVYSRTDFVRERAKK